MPCNLTCAYVLGLWKGGDGDFILPILHRFLVSPNSRWTVPVFKGIGENITASVFLKELILSNQTTLGAEVGGILNVQIRNNFPLPRKMN